MENPALSGSALAKEAARLADDKQAENIVVLDVRGLSNIADYFVICGANSLPHLNAIRKEVRDQIKTAHGVATYGVEGGGESEWAVLDFVDVVVHILLEGKRSFYSLESLWADAPRVEWQPAGADRS